ncbi:hypothetical protein ACPJHQ_12375 [Rossellomorea sp. H39__3]
MNKKLKAEEATLEQLMETKKQIEARLVKAKAYFEEEARRQEERDQVERYVLELEGMEKQIQSIDELQRDTAVLKKEQDQCLQNVHTNKKQAEVIRGGIKEREAELEKADDLFEEIHGVEETIREKEKNRTYWKSCPSLFKKKKHYRIQSGPLGGTRLQMMPVCPMHGPLISILRISVTPLMQTGFLLYWKRTSLVRSAGPFTTLNLQQGNRNYLQR